MVEYVAIDLIGYCINIGYPSCIRFGGKIYGCLPLLNREG
jgi:hypothetical protein